MTPHLPLMINHFLRRELRSLRLELEAYPDEQLIWVLPPGLPNSAGTLALHLAGNLRHYVGAVLGGNGYVRNRDQEFAARDVPRVVLLDQVAEAEAAVESILPQLSEAQMSQPFPEPIREHRLQATPLTERCKSRARRAFPSPPAARRNGCSSCRGVIGRLRWRPGSHRTAGQRERVTSAHRPAWLDSPGG